MLNKLEKICENLTYTSDSDGELVVFEARSVDFEALMDGQVLSNPEWETLKDFMTKNLTNLQVIRFGEIETILFVFGEKDGKLFGFKTCGVET